MNTGNELLDDALKAAMDAGVSPHYVMGVLAAGLVAADLGSGVDQVVMAAQIIMGEVHRVTVAQRSA